MDARFAPLVGCFALSGFAALLYQTAWARELSFVFGTSELAVAAVLAAYMGGLALGSAAAARIAPRLTRPVLVYGMLELAIAVSALLVPTGIRLVDAAYVALLGGRPDLPEASAATTLFQLAGAFAVLLPPTALMGATLPLLARHAVRSDALLGSRVGVLYAFNTAGAIAGAICAAFLLIPELGLRRSVWIGAGANGAVFALAALLARGAPAAPDPGDGARAVRTGAEWILPAIALSGAVSFAYEVLWTRLLSHLLGGSLHAFATMLAGFLLGIALGSAVAARLATTRERARVGFAIAQLGIAATSYTVFALADRLPELARRLGAGFDDPLASAALAATALLPFTLFIGATFPFAVRVLADQPEQAARATARIYAWNTVGAIAGALGAGFVLLPQLGFEGTISVGVSASLSLAAVGAIAPAPRRWKIAVVAGVLVALVALAPPRIPWTLLRYAPLREERGRGGEVVFAAVGRSSSVVVIDRELHWTLFTNGLPEAGIDRVGVLPFPASMAFWLGFLPALVRPDARSLLVVGLGGGTTLEAVPASVEAIDVVELEPAVVEANRAIAVGRARDPLADPRVRVRIGDARGSLRLSAKQYDAIISQPSHPWTAGASHLYTREFFELARARLRPNGVFVQWMGLRYVDEDLLKSLVAALVEVFGNVEIYMPSPGGVLFAASVEPLAGLSGAADALRADPEGYARFGVNRVDDLACAWQLDADGVRELARGAQPITDDDNPLALRASRLGDRGLDLPSARRLFEARDPLRSLASEWDRGVLMRWLVRTGQAKRGRELANADGEAARERDLGWVDFATNRPENAARHFTRARSLEPDDRDALLGLVASRRAELASGPVAEIPETELDAPVAAVIAGWRDLKRGDRSAIARRDGELAQLAPGDALFRDAARQRAQWRLAAGDRAAAAEASAILARALIYEWRADDGLLYAQAAIAAGEPAFAWGALERIAESGTDPNRLDNLRRALEIAQALPPEWGARLRGHLIGGDPAARAAITEP